MYLYDDKISDMIAHFIGLFETTMDEARMRQKYLKGKSQPEKDPALQADEIRDRDFASRLELQDYAPGVNYRAPNDDWDYAGYRPARGFDDALDRLHAGNATGLSAPRTHHLGAGPFPQEQELVIHEGPGSIIAHTVQVNLLQDDDYLNMTDSVNIPRDTTFVTARLIEFYDKAEAYVPFSGFTRTDEYAKLQDIARDIHDYIDNARENDITSLNTGADVDFVLAAHQINGVYINGVLSEEAPDVNDFMPDRGIAKPAEEPEKSDVSLEDNNEHANIVDVATGANVVANVATLTNTGVMAPVMAVMGDYHQIDAITQAYIYSDRDEIDTALTTSENHTATAAYNIASFERGTYENAPHPSSVDDDGNLVFPTAWRVSVVEGDVCFVNWLEQYQFISDNDTMTITTTGNEVSVLTGGNAAINLFSFLGISTQFDLIIVGGNVLDMNIISQIAVLYDNDWARALSDMSDTNAATVQSGNNLIWNQASIHNIGDNDRFETMPDHIGQAVDAINERDPNLPTDFATDPTFAGHEGLNVLYITGNLYDVTLIKQVSILGDSDDVTQAASKVLENNHDATVTIDTGSNALVNIAQIIDYDSFGSTTYLAGNLYSDAILIQGGIIEHDTSQPQPVGSGLANEVIAFLDDDNPAVDNTDGVLNAGHDLSWSLAHPVDVMQSVVA
ncbi:hypothetical protein [Agrobacterium sp.]|uniref:hypothetical protein n=1 Tax=Agrobacterium sp. TaxID=361 RepID=UPI0028ABF619|nr:hypothetical protein [Agrobacterium sp.]